MTVRVEMRNDCVETGQMAEVLIYNDDQLVARATPVVDVGMLSWSLKKTHAYSSTPNITAHPSRLLDNESTEMLIFENGEVFAVVVATRTVKVGPDGGMYEAFEISLE